MVKPEAARFSLCYGATSGDVLLFPHWKANQEERPES